MNIKNLIKKGQKYLKERNIPTPEFDSELLLAYTLKKPKEFLYTYPNKKISKLLALKFFYYTYLRGKNIPAAYITKKKEFFKLDFIVNKNVLIPRPDTEILVEQALSIINNSKVKLNVADLGTGSGCIPISILKNSDIVKNFYAVDISKKALKIAKQNAEKHNVKNNIEFLLGNFLEPVRNKKIDIIISNPPYLSNKEFIDNPDLYYEPRNALVSKTSALSCYETIFSQIKNYNLKPKYILLEIPYNLSQEIVNLAKKHIHFYNIKIIKDLSEKDRVLVFSQSKLI